MILGPMNYDAHGCTANEPHPYVGVWNDYSGWKVLANAYPSSWGSYLDTGSQNLGAGTRTAFVGIEAASSVNLNCGHDYRLGGATLYIADPEKPTINWVSGYPTGWVKNNFPFTISVNVSDPGLGVSWASISPKEAPPLKEAALGCNGHYNSQCPANYTFQWNVSSDSFDYGEKEVQASARDPLGVEDPSGHYSQTTAWTMKVDPTPPEVELAGQLARATDETEGDGKDETGFDKLTMPVYNLTVNTTDGSNASAGAKRSGVKSVEVFLDGKGTPEQTWAQPGAPASCDSCTLNVVYTLKLNELSADVHHTLRVVAKDYAGNTPRERNIEFEYIPATGISGEYVMQHFPLPNGQGNEDEEENPVRPELAVNLVNGNLVYHQLDAEVPGAAADLEVERFYNSLLPSAQDSEFGDGWTLAQTPTLEIEDSGAPGPPEEATVVQESGAVESRVELPTQNGEELFNPEIQAVVTKVPGGFEVSDESGESGSPMAFNEAGEATEERTSDYAGVEIEREGGQLSEIAVDDPAATDLLPGEVKEPVDPPTFQSAFGATGTAGGQLKRPGDVAFDAKGNLWVLEKANHRVQEFDESGQFILTFGREVNRTKTEAGAPEAERNICTAASGNVCQAGKTGSGNGQLNSPSALAIGPAGEVWVADTVNNRLQEFSSTGEFIRKAGSQGTGNGQLREPFGVAVDPKGNVWVADTVNKRIEEFSATGEFLKVLGAGELGIVFEVAIGPSENVFVSESARIKVYSQAGALLHQFGEVGSGPGQFSTAGGLEVDSKGEVWVADTVGDRIVGFSEAGDPIATFGAPGSGAGQLNLTRPAGLVAGSEGDLWIADAENNRVQRWQAFGYHQTAKESALPADDPSIEVESSSGLVESVTGEEAGEVSYDHSGELLTAADGPEGETTYQYNGDKRLTKVTLPNGTWGEIAYEPTYGRVKSMTVSVEGKAPKTTQFEYTDAPSRSTRVIPAGEPAVTYDISDEGGVLRWSNAKEPPVIDDIGGKLHDVEARETADPIAPGTYNLTVQAHSPEGITSIQVIANGNTLVSEKTCEKPKPWLECTTQNTEWVTETAALVPGILYLEVVTTDRLGQSTGEKFWVNVPYTPPPDPEAEEPPRFSDIEKFREEFGLDLDLKGDDEAINDRIFDLMGAWNNPNTPAGEVARSTAERWALPMRVADAAEMEYRQMYSDHDLPAISEWASSHFPGTFSGAYIDQRAGGILRAGFTADQAQRLKEIEQQVSLASPEGRRSTYLSTPVTALFGLSSMHEATLGELEQSPTWKEAITSVELDEEAGLIALGASNVAKAQELVTARFGSQAPFQIFFLPGIDDQAGRNRASGRIQAGDHIITHKGNCTAGFGAYEDRTEKSTGEPVRARFLLTAAHCADSGTLVVRSANPSSGPFYEVGPVNRRGNESGIGRSDSEAIRVNGGLAPNSIFRNGFPPLSVGEPSRAHRNDLVCFSGITTNKKKCGKLLGEVGFEVHNYLEIFYIVKMHTRDGDSGAPVWNPTTERSIGLIKGEPEGYPQYTLVAPLYKTPGEPETRSPGVLKALSLPNPPQMRLIVGH
ncbi:MAG TPA: DUF6531 domain-containing protein [Solirubrobacterales bacterium]|nr:DUF6531 domain-containing protein [Solirubrobacterales bacterium]